jgi:hypothetical protein
MDPVYHDTLARDVQAASDAQASIGQSRSWRSVMVWGLLGTISVVYLGLLIARPEVLSNYLPTVTPVGAPESNEGQRANALAAAEDLRERVDTLEGEVKSLRDDVTAKTDSLSLKSVGLDDRLTAMEVAKIAAAPAIPVKAGKPNVAPLTQIAPAVTAAVPAQAPAAPAPVAAAPAPAPVAAAPVPPAPQPAKKVAAPITAAAKPVKPAPVVAPTVAATPSPVNAASAIAPPFQSDVIPGVKLLNSIPPPAAPAPAPVDASAPATKPLTTGSIDPAQRTAKPVGVYIGSGSSLEAVRSSWSQLTQRAPEAIAGLQPRYKSSMDAAGMSYGLLAGPLKSTAEAQKVCQDLAAKSVNCRIGEYGGEAL